MSWAKGILPDPLPVPALQYFDEYGHGAIMADPFRLVPHDQTKRVHASGCGSPEHGLGLK